MGGCPGEYLPLVVDDHAAATMDGGGNLGFRCHEPIAAVGCDHITTIVQSPSPKLEFVPAPTIVGLDISGSVNDFGTVDCQAPRCLRVTGLHTNTGADVPDLRSSDRIKGVQIGTILLNPLIPDIVGDTGAFWSEHLKLVVLHDDLALGINDKPDVEVELVADFRFQSPELTADIGSILFCFLRQDLSLRSGNGRIEQGLGHFLVLPVHLGIHEGLDSRFRNSH